MDDKMFKAGIALIGLGGVWLGNLYGKMMYAKGRVDADAMYKPILDADSKLIHTLVERLQKFEGSQK